MTVEIHNLKELDALENGLKYNDFVYFHVEKKVTEYRVRLTFLKNSEFTSSYLYNGEIFDILKLDKCKFATEYYGYKVGYGGWPESRDNDFPALTRLVKALYEEIEGVPIFEPISRFDLMILE